MAYRVFYTSDSEKQLSKFAKNEIKRIIQKTGNLRFPFPKSLDIKKMINTPNFYRLRVGKIRIIFEVDSKKCEIWIRKIRYRGSAYR